MDVYETLESCGSVMVVCEYNGSEVNVYGGEKRRVSVVGEEEREEERSIRVVVCEYNGSVVDVYGIR